MKKTSKKFLTLALSAAMLSAVGVGAAISVPEKANADTDTVTFATIGASVRNEGVAGMRFTNVVKEKTDGATYGTLIIPENVLAGAELTVNTDKVLKIEAVNWNDALAEKAGYTDYRAYTGVVVGTTLETAFPATEYGRSFVARGYMTVGNETTYTDPIVRSMAGVAAAALANPNDTSTALLEGIVDSVAEGFSFTEEAVTLDLGEVEALTLTGTNGLTPIYTVSDNTTVWVGKNGEVQGLKNGTATVTATLGSYTDTLSVTVESAGSSLGDSGSIANGIVKLHGTTRTALPYIALTDCVPGDIIEAEFTGQNTPVIHFMAESVHGNFKETTNTGMLVDNSPSVFRIYPRYSEAGDATVLEPAYANNKLDANTNYVLKAWVKTDTAENYIVVVEFYSKDSSGARTLLTSASKTMTAAAMGLTAGNPNYIILYGNATGGSTTTFSYRVYKSGEAVDIYTTDSSARPCVYNSTTGELKAYHNADRDNACYVAFETGLNKYFELKWTGTAMPAIRLGTTVLTVKSKDPTGGGYTISNTANSSFRVYTGGDAGETTLKTMGADLVDNTNYVLRAGLEDRGGVYYLHVDLYTETEGTLTNIFTLGENQKASNVTTPNGLYLIFYGNNGKNKTIDTYYTAYELGNNEVENVMLNEETGVVTFAKSAVDTTYQISVNGGEWVDVTSTGYTASYTIGGFEDGKYTVVVRSSDGSELTTKTFTVATQQEAPVDS